jgi:beta-lactamase class D
MICPECNKKLEKIEVNIEDAETTAISYQCPNCDHFNFEPESTMKIINELKEKESPLKMKQKIIKLSKDRLGMYFNQDLINSLDLRSGEDIFISVPNNKRIVLDIKKTMTTTP